MTNLAACREASLLGDPSDPSSLNTTPYLTSSDSENLLALTEQSSNRITSDYSSLTQDAHSKALIFCYGLTVGLVSASFYQFYAYFRRKTKSNNYQASLPAGFRLVLEHVVTAVKSFNEMLMKHFSNSRAFAEISLANECDSRPLSAREFSSTVIHFTQCTCFSLAICRCLCRECKTCNLRKLRNFYQLKSLLSEQSLLESTECSSSTIADKTRLLRSKVLRIATSLFFDETSIVKSNESGFHTSQASSVSIKASCTPHVRTSQTYSAITSSNSTPMHAKKLVAAVQPQTRRSNDLERIFSDSDLRLRASSTPYCNSKQNRNQSFTEKCLNCNHRQLVQLYDQAVQTSPLHKPKLASYQLPEDENLVSTTTTGLERSKSDTFRGVKSHECLDTFIPTADIISFANEDHYADDDERQQLMLSELYSYGEDCSDSTDDSNSTSEEEERTCPLENFEGDNLTCTNQELEDSALEKKPPLRRPATMATARDAANSSQQRPLGAQRMTRSALVTSVSNRGLYLDEGYYRRLSKLTSSIACELDDVGKSMLSLRNRLASDDLELQSAEDEMERVYDAIFQSVPNTPRSNFRRTSSSRPYSGDDVDQDHDENCCCNCHHENFERKRFTLPDLGPLDLELDSPEPFLVQPFSSRASSPE